MSEELNVLGIARENILVTGNCHRKFKSYYNFCHAKLAEQFPFAQISLVFPTPPGEIQSN